MPPPGWRTKVNRSINWCRYVSYFSGIPGGIFAPCLAVGAAIGANVAELFGLAAQPMIALFIARDSEALVLAI
ncbi:chloride channel protein [Rhodococcus sp. IEGM1300]